MDLWKCLFDRPFLEGISKQFREEALAMVRSGIARPVFCSRPGAGEAGAAATGASLKPQTINEFRKTHVERHDSPVALGELFDGDESSEDMWVLQYKFYVIMYLSDPLLESVMMHSPKVVTDGFLRHFRSYFERHVCGAGSASKKKGIAKTMLVNTDPIDFVVGGSIRVSQLYNKC